MNERVLKYWVSALPEIILWVVLYFCFNHDYQREDFVFIPIEASQCIGLLIGIRLRKIIINTINRWHKT